MNCLRLYRQSDEVVRKGDLNHAFRIIVGRRMETDIGCVERVGTEMDLFGNPAVLFNRNPHHVAWTQEGAAVSPPNPFSANMFAVEGERAGLIFVEVQDEWAQIIRAVNSLVFPTARLP